MYRNMVYFMRPIKHINHKIALPSLKNENKIYKNFILKAMKEVQEFMVKDGKPLKDHQKLLRNLRVDLCQIDFIFCIISPDIGTSQFLCGLKILFKVKLNLAPLKMNYPSSKLFRLHLTFLIKNSQ